MPSEKPAPEKKDPTFDFATKPEVNKSTPPEGPQAVTAAPKEERADQRPVEESKSTREVPTIDDLVEMDGEGYEDIPSNDLCDYQEFFIPILDFVRFTEDELAIIDHPAFQRLGKIYQLGQSHLVYRGATHKRLEHSLGTAHVAQKMVNAVRATYNGSQAKPSPVEARCAFDEPPSVLETRFIRLAALLHDIGHLAAGHTLEDELCLLAPHDGESRLKLIFRKPDWIPGVTSQTLEATINDRYNRYLSEDAPNTASDIVRLIISKGAQEIKLTSGIRIAVCKDIVGNTICADLLDYLHRDWYHIGRPKFFEKRLFQYMQIRKDARDQSPKFVISYGDKNRPKRDGISAILKLLESRYDLAEAVLFHPTKCSAAAMLERGISEFYDALRPEERQQWVDSLESRFLSYSDDELLSSLLSEAIAKGCRPATVLLQNLALRNTYKSACLIMKDDVGPGCYDLLVHKFLGLADPKRSKTRTLEQKQMAATARRQALAYFEEDLELPQGSVVMYCPPPDMNSKLAEVKIIRDGAIRTLEEWDKPPYRLAGGHCNAQMARFESLWRVEIFIEEDTKNKLESELHSHLEQAIKLLLLGITDDGAQPDSAVLDLAKHVVTLSGRFHNRTVSELAAARGSATRYPLGAPLLKSFFSK